MSMQYFEWIEQYRQNQLSMSDRLAFEHELSENEILRKELDTMELTDQILSKATFTVHTTIPTILPKKRKKLILSASAMILVICSLLFLALYSNQKSTKMPKPGAEQEFVPNTVPQIDDPDKMDTRPIAENVKEPSSKTIPDEKVDAQQLKNSMPVKKSGEVSSPAPNEASTGGSLQSKSTSNSKKKFQKVAVYKVSAVLDTILPENSDIAFTATEEIKLKPGFHAKSGTSFSARIKAGPILDTKSLSH